MRGVLKPTASYLGHSGSTQETREGGRWLLRPAWTWPNHERRFPQAPGVHSPMVLVRNFGMKLESQSHESCHLDSKSCECTCSVEAPRTLPSCQAPYLPRMVRAPSSIASPELNWAPPSHTVKQGPWPLPLPPLSPILRTPFLPNAKVHWTSNPKPSLKIRKFSSGRQAF